MAYSRGLVRNRMVTDGSHNNRGVSHTITYAGGWLEIMVSLGFVAAGFIVILALHVMRVYR